MSSRVYLFFPPRGHEPPPTLRDRLNCTLTLITMQGHQTKTKQKLCVVLYIYINRHAGTPDEN